MALSSLLGRFKAKRADPVAIAAIKAQVLEQLGSPANLTIAVNEIDCNDPSCPGLETIVLIMAEGQKTRACKISKPIEDVLPEDIGKALSETNA